MASRIVRTVLIGLGGAAVLLAISWVAASRHGASPVAPAPLASVPIVPAVPAPAKVAAGKSLASKPAKPKGIDNPMWRELSIAQQDALMPLVDEWNKLDGTRKQKWLDIANRFGAMHPDEQKRVSERMREWARLTPEERRVARENYARSKKIEPAQRSAQWELYQQLPEEQKKKLAADAVVKKQLAKLPARSNNATTAPAKSGTPSPAGAAKPAAPAPPDAAPATGSAPPPPVTAASPPASLNAK